MATDWTTPTDPTTSWTASTSTSLTWTAPSTSYASGNWTRFVDADPLVDASGGVDFGNTITSENPFVVSDVAPLSLLSATRNDP